MATYPSPFTPSAQGFSNQLAGYADPLVRYVASLPYEQKQRLKAAVTDWFTRREAKNEARKARDKKRKRLGIIAGTAGLGAVALPFAAPALGLAGAAGAAPAAAGSAASLVTGGTAAGLGLPAATSGLFGAGGALTAGGALGAGLMGAGLGAELGNAFVGAGDMDASYAERGAAINNLRRLAPMSAMGAGGENIADWASQNPYMAAMLAIPQMDEQTVFMPSPEDDEEAAQPKQVVSTVVPTNPYSPYVVSPSSPMSVRPRWDDFGF